MDNSGALYPMMITHRTQSLFRLAVSLDGDIEPTALQRAVDTALTRFPFYRTRLVKGFFRPYLKENNKSAVVVSDDALLRKINLRQNNRYFLRIAYKGSRLAIEFFHGLCDAGGGINFLKSVIYYYYQNIGRPIPSEGILTVETPEKEGEYEDAFEKYYQKQGLLSGASKLANGSAQKAVGRQKDYYSLTQIKVPTDKLLEKARKLGVTVTAVISAIAMLSIAQNADDKQTNDAIAFVPINLRKAFPSNTMANFTVFAKCVIPKDTKKTFEAYLHKTAEELKRELTTEEMQRKLSVTSLLNRGLLKFTPFCVKKFLYKIGKALSFKSMQTMIISNLGNIPPVCGAQGFVLNMNVSKKTPVNMGVSSGNGITYLCVTSKLENNDTETRIAENLRAIGLEVEVEEVFS